MRKEDNLIPASDPRGHKLTVEEQSMGGKESAKVQKEKRRRGEILREIVNTEITNEKMLANLRALGILKDHPTLEDYINATATRDLTKRATMQDLQRMNDELYGLQDRKSQVELSGEISGITINVKKYNQGADDADRN